MQPTLFFILNGNNGATYIVNTNSLKTIKTSLQFYKTRTVRSCFIKIGLIALCYFVKMFGSKNLKHSEYINNYLKRITKSNLNFNISPRVSVLISPTQDKVIVNHHEKYFQKFAFGKSLNNVKKEADIYKLFEKKPSQFQVSTFFDEHKKNHEFYSFKLSNASVNTSKNSNINNILIPSLAAFVKYGTISKICFKDYIVKFQKANTSKNLKLNSNTLRYINNEFSRTMFPLGLVHKDFKPWNVLPYETPLFYDFEETILNGCPLEDLFNYYIDPIIRHKSTKFVHNNMLSKVKILHYTGYLKALHIEVHYKLFLFIYLFERSLFWDKAGEQHTAHNFVKLLNSIRFKDL